MFQSFHSMHGLDMLQLVDTKIGEQSQLIKANESTGRQLVQLYSEFPPVRTSLRLLVHTGSNQLRAINRQHKNKCNIMR
jgi:hypothetical protein